MLEKLKSNFKQSHSGSKDTDGQKESNSDKENGKSHDSSDNEEAKKKKVSMIIRVVVILGLAYLAIDHFLLEQPEVVVAVKPGKNKKKNTPKVIAGNSAQNLPKVPEVADGTKESENPKDLKDTKDKPVAHSESAPKKEEKVIAEAPVENINIADKKIDEAITPLTTAAPEIEIEKEKPKEKAIVVNTPVVPEVAEIRSPAVGEIKDQHLDKSLDSLIDSVDNHDKVPKSDTPKKKTMEETIVADDTYTPPPAYDQLGRGLVYNCKEKYWACVDKFAYVACNKNMKWDTAHQKTTECAVQNVYNSEEDCSVVQKYNVSTSKTTPFCQ